jgi:sulfatase modifying factor 1
VDFDLGQDLGDGERIQLDISADGGETFGVPVIEVSGDVGEGIMAGKGKRITWDGRKDWPGRVSYNLLFRVSVISRELEEMEGFSYVPGGWFVMGGLPLGKVVLPDCRVYVDPVRMQTTEVTFGEWKEVRDWGREHGYVDLPAGEGKGGNHPVAKLGWGDAVKWCNAASEMAGRVPCYQLDGQAYRTGPPKGLVCDWDANGFRLPTEAEWERAARCGKRRKYAWDGPLVLSKANYNAWAPGDKKSPRPEYWREAPFTAPVGSFPPNEYGLYDMVGNVREMCWDFYSSDYPYSGQRNPRGPESGTLRTLRGGSFADGDGACSAVFRRDSQHLSLSNTTGFRMVARAEPGKVASAEEILVPGVFDFDLEFVDAVKR